MKKSIKVFAVFFIMAAFAFIPPKHSLVGRWVSHHKNGSVASYVVFKTDGSFVHTSPKGKLLHQGKYKLNNDTFSIYDKTCGVGYWGKYKLNFYGADSVSFAVIEDSCSGREHDVNGGGIRRLKKK
jgi:hypothetical protein